MATLDYPFKRYASYDRETVAAVLDPRYTFQAQRGSWGISGIVRFGEGPNYVFFVSFGQTQGQHEFEEAVYENGVIRWQSQPSQKLTDPVIQNLITHDPVQHDILLFLRTTTRGPYKFLGFLKYLNHTDRDQPVTFHWEILDFDQQLDYESLLGLRLQPIPGTVNGYSTSPDTATNTARQLREHPSPEGVRRGTALPAHEFVARPVDYELRDRQNRGLGKIGEHLVIEHEQNHLREHGRSDLAAKVELVCCTMGDGVGYDVKSFDFASGEEIHIEVKTTTGPATTPFYMTASEVEYARRCSAKYRLYRVYNCTPAQNEVPFFILENPFAEDRLDLAPVNYRVRMK